MKYAIVSTETNMVIEVQDFYDEWGDTPSGHPVLTLEVPAEIEDEIEAGWLWNKDTGEFYQYVPDPTPPEPEPYEPEPTQEEIFDKILINTEYLAAMAEMEAEA